MMKLAVVAALLCGGCGLTAANGAALGLSTMTLAVDWKMTHAAADVGWSGGYGHREEANPIMGPHPSTGMVNTYFLSVIAINALVWYVTPRRYRMVVPLAVVAVQANTIAGNIRENGLAGSLGLGPATGSR